MQRIGFSTTTMHPVTEHSSFVSRQPHVIASVPAVLARCSSCRLLPFPEDEEAAEGLPFHTVAEIQHESQKVMDLLTQNDFEPHSSSGRNAVTSALLRKVTISKEMVFKLR
jgi:hypothetical protein